MERTDRPEKVEIELFQISKEKRFFNGVGKVLIWIIFVGIPKGVALFMGIWISKLFYDNRFCQNLNSIVASFFAIIALCCFEFCGLSPSKIIKMVDSKFTGFLK